MAAPPVGRYKIGPITEKDTLVEYAMTPRHTVKTFQVGDAIQHLAPGSEESSILPDLREVLPLIKEMPVYEDDVFIIASAKTGTHWTWEIVNMLMKGTTDYEKMSKARRQLEFHYPDEFKDMPRPRVFNTHLLLHHIPKQAIEKKCKVIVVQRNPKDTVVSLFYHMKASGAFDAETTFSEFLSAWMKLETVTNHNWFYYTKKLQEMLYDQTNLPIHNVYYEDMKSNPVGEVKKIVEYLGINRADDFIHQVVDKCCFDNLKKADDTKVSALEGIPKQAFSFMYRKGEVGDWKNHFTVADNEEFDRIYNEKMNGIKFTYKYTL
ncbi:Hypothetical predicted protein [Mytilus galloprovincialis]|uniref:Sulfotransferase domain-containing protein n=2 Tax=Mytilus galloprovincialis TaxID=29158 RepID=A0A8B6HGU1_MYTGA|nr:Hypothetical predicted protein [Mytilus galloprovincialis]